MNGLISIGNEYGNWIIPSNFLTEDSIVYLVGAGEDISFETYMAISESL